MQAEQGLTLKLKPRTCGQELCQIVLLAYNLVRYQMIKMAEHLAKGYWPNQLSFSESCGMAVMRMLDDIAGHFWDVYRG